MCLFCISMLYVFLLCFYALIYCFITLLQEKSIKMKFSWSPKMCFQQYYYITVRGWSSCSENGRTLPTSVFHLEGLIWHSENVFSDTIYCKSILTQCFYIRTYFYHRNICSIDLGLTDPHLTDLRFRRPDFWVRLFHNYCTSLVDTKKVW
jgi:hypothetical protein